ncbi:translation initiation factor eIF-2B alpha/beta/delta subunit family protein [Mycobacteroides abscessus]|uniref:hypothetical protein n=1 Tax=Mycobacteroides abscessus TaxID=36809 RepID=UPI0009A7B042|nr:hypothetical protein [Mycobacteroides abscessus]SKT21235.1 gp13 protein [Mycobacteroides abscessus subsp. bolletii]
MSSPVTFPSIVFDPPQAPPLSDGLYQHVIWPDAEDLPRFLLHEGVVIRPHNYGSATGFGVWGAAWSAKPDDINELKKGERPDTTNLTPFKPETVFGADHNYNADLTAASRQEVRDRALRNLERNDSMAIERELAARMLADAGTPTAATGIVDALSKLEAAIGRTGAPAFIHASFGWSAHFSNARLLSGITTPRGNTVIFGGGYVDGLNDVLVATSQVYGWRGDVQELESIEEKHNYFIAVAERSVLLGYEKLVAAVKIS